MAQGSRPAAYKAIIAESTWLYLGRYHRGSDKIVLADTVKPVDLMLFDEGRKYRKIKGSRIVSNSDFVKQRIVYVDSLTLILEQRGRKGRVRDLYRRQP